MTYQTVKTLSPLDAGYLAGLIDGEGTITLSRRNLNKQRGLVVTISNTEMSILTHVQKITGVGKITNKRISKIHHTPSFTYHATNRQALDILNQIANHLRSYKADRARLALRDLPGSHQETADTLSCSFKNGPNSLKIFWRLK